MSNVYYHPEQFGLEQFGLIDGEPGSYEFDYLVVWRELSTGRLWWAADSGCSCPSPFEEYTFPSRGEYRLKRVNTARGFAIQVARWMREYSYRRNEANAAATALVTKVREYLERPTPPETVAQQLERFVRSGELEGDLREAGYSKEQAEFVVQAVFASLNRNVPF